MEKLRLIIHPDIMEIPSGTESISTRAYESKSDLIRVKVPGTVKKIGERAFADCVNLKEVILQEGILCIESNAFTECKALKSIQIPDSVTDIRGNAFFYCGLKEPVFSASGDRLIYCPEEAAGSVYTVPEGVKEIGSQAFFNLKELKKVVLPDSLEVIHFMAFVHCGITEMVIPDQVKTIETMAFYHCKELTYIQRNNVPDPVRARLDLFRIRGHEFLVPYALKLPEEKHWLDREFHALARECSLGNAEAMQEMAEYFREKAKQTPETSFYTGAFQFWICRAYEWGSKKAEEYLKNWFQEHEENKRMYSSYLSEGLRGAGDGTALRALGFFFFEEGIHYHLEGKDNDGAVEVSAWVDDDGPDEDGFGREEYYDYWYLDNCLNLPQEGKCLHKYSRAERRMDECFKEQQEIAAEAVRKRKENLPGLSAAGRTGR